MPDNSGEPPPSSQEQAGDLRPPSANAPTHLAPAPRVHPTAAHHPSNESQTKQLSPEKVQAALKWLQNQGKLNLDAASPTTQQASHEQTSRARLSKDQRKFHKFDPEHPNPPPSVPEEVDDSPSTLTLPEVQTENSPRGMTAEQFAFMRRLADEASERRRWIALVLAVLAFLLVTAAFVVSHSTAFRKMIASQESSDSAQKLTSLPEVPRPQSPEVTDSLDQAMAAEQAGDYPKAIELLERVQREPGHVNGLNYRLASACYKADQTGRVIPLLNLSIAAGEDLAACYSLRGTLSNQVEGTVQEPSDLEIATRLEPFNAHYFFLWGEALRRAGKPRLALVQLERAATRLQEPALVDPYALKIRLTQIELGEDQSITTEMAAKLKDSPQPLDWVLTAAAVEMQRGNFPAAAGFLDQARALHGEHVVLRELQDVFFKKFAHEAELSRFFESPPSP